jgi:fructose-1,6-bisphosphatase/inositol monophosphatase family enzyme
VSDDYELAAELVIAAGHLAAEMRREGVYTEQKTSISDIVTAADKAAEHLIVERLRAVRPEDGIIGEEGASVAGSRTWLLDPIDGTYNYASGLPTWCAALALRDDDGAVLGAIYQPATDELWLGGRGRATTANGQPLAAMEDRPLAEISLASYLHPTSLPDRAVREPLLRVMTAAATVRMLGSGSVELAAVAAGRLGAYLQANCLPWDWLPGQALVEAAGGATAVLERDGQRWHVAANRQACAEVVALLEA